MLLVLLTAENCGGPGESYKSELKVKKISDEYQNIENEFMKDELSMEDLNAFKIRAVQKLKDIADYINITADTSISVQFRKQASQMIRENFIEKSDLKIFYKNLEILEDTLNSALYYIKYGGIFKTEFNSIEIVNHFQKDSDLKYSGEIQFSQRISYLNQLDTVVTSFTKRISMVALKTEKNFGNETQEVWEVYLGEVKN
jgi:hypothetical protein